jgi:SP family general alpha glucoside:H+ symporter-like MFS transporter
MSDPIDSKSFEAGAEVEATKVTSQVEHAYDLDEKAKVSDYKADAIEAENAEHNMGVLEAVRAYPMASFWAFVFSFTIVSCISPISFPFWAFPPTRTRG